MGEEEEIKILHVDDTEMDRLIVKRALEKSKLRNRLFVCEDGEQALDFLYHRGDYTSREEYPQPDVILLDLNMPKVDGITVLKQIKSDEELKNIPVLIFTTSDRDEDIIRTFEDGVSSYLLKSKFVHKTAEMVGLFDTILSLVRGRK